MTRVIVLLPDLDFFLYNFCIHFHKLSICKYSAEREFRGEIAGGMFSFHSKHSVFTPRKCYWSLCLPFLITLGKRG